MKDDFHLDTKDVEVVRKALEAQGVKDIKGVALYALPMGEARWVRAGGGEQTQ